MKARPPALRAIAAAALASLILSGCPRDPPKPDPQRILEAGVFDLGAYRYVVGGADAKGGYLSTVWRGAIAPDGSAGDWIGEADLPVPLAGAACMATATMAYVIGGRDAEGQRDEILFTLINADGSLGFSSSVWTENKRPLPEARAGAKAVSSGGRVYLVGGADAAGGVPATIAARVWNDGEMGFWYDAPAVSDESDIGADPAAPRVFPSGGLVKAGTKLAVAAYPGDRVYWSVAALGSVPPDPTEASADSRWEESPNALPVISSDSSCAFRAFRAGIPVAGVLRADYRTFSAGMFMLIKKELSPADAAAFVEERLVETYSAGASLDVSAVWYRVSVGQRMAATFAWMDAEDPAGSVLTARVRLSLFEDPGCSAPARLADAEEFFRWEGGFANPRTAVLSAGDYYLLVEARDEASAGGSFSLKILAGE